MSTKGTEDTNTSDLNFSYLISNQFSLFTPFKDADDAALAVIVPVTGTFVLAATTTLLPFMSGFAGLMVLGSFAAAAGMAVLLDDDEAVEFSLQFASTVCDIFLTYCAITAISFLAAFLGGLSLVTRTGALIADQFEKFPSSTDDFAANEECHTGNTTEGCFI